MNVAFVTQPWDEVLPPEEGGGVTSIGIVAQELAQRLARSCEITIYSRRGQGQQKMQRDNAGIVYRRIGVTADNWFLKPLKLSELLLGMRKATHPLFSSPLYYWGYALRVAIDIRQRGCDVVHIFNLSQFAPMIRAFNPATKIVLHMECEWLTQLDPVLIAKRLDTVDLVIGCSDFITEQIRQRFPKSSDKCKTIFNGVDVNHFCLPDQRRRAGRNQHRILYVGRISPEKGVHVLLEAFQEVVKCIPQAELVLVGAPGEAPYEYTIQVNRDQETRKLSSFYHPITKRGWGNYMRFLNAQVPATLAKQICFTGAVLHADLVDFYRNATLFVFPSVWEEPFGIPLIEAMACQQPVVATRGGGIPEIVDEGVSGLLVERGNASALARAIIHLLEDEEMSDAMGIQGGARVSEHFSWDRIAEILLVEYQNGR